MLDPIKIGRKAIWLDRDVWKALRARACEEAKTIRGLMHDLLRRALKLEAPK